MIRPPERGVGAAPAVGRHGRGPVPCGGTGPRLQHLGVGVSRDSDGADVLRLRALLALRDVELDLLALDQLTEAGRLDVRVVSEDVGAAAVLLDEAVALFAVEPLHGAGSHNRLHFHWGIGTHTSCAPRSRDPHPETKHRTKQMRLSVGTSRRTHTFMGTNTATASTIARRASSMAAMVALVTPCFAAA